MTIKEAILKTLDELVQPANHKAVFKHINNNNYYKFEAGRTPESTISAELGNFIRKGDSRVKRVKNENNSYSYYLSKHEQSISFLTIEAQAENLVESKKKNKKEKSTYEERDLHLLLSTYLNDADVYSKTIFHEQSNNKDSSQIWTHPDMVSLKIIKLQNKSSQVFFNSVNKLGTFRLSSFELKREINTDNELKKAYFQAVSNSSWANYGFLVAYEFNDSLNEEMARLNQSFGIGIIELNANPFESKVLFPAQLRELDFKTIDKLCNMNKEFDEFIYHSKELLNAQNDYSAKGTQIQFKAFCDKYFNNDQEFEEYCELKNIPAKNKDSV